MEFKINRKHILYFIIISMISCKSTITNTKHTLVIRVHHINLSVPEYSATAYSILNLNLLNDFKFTKNEKNGNPQIMYNITANGGKLIMDYFNALDTYGCCEYGDILKAFVKNKSGTIPEDKFNQYSYINEMTLAPFNDTNSQIYNYSKGDELYLIHVWLAELEYCECEFWMYTPQHYGVDNRGVLLTSIKSVVKPDDKLKEKLDSIFIKIIEL